MIVAEVKRTLLRQAQSSWIGFTKNILDFTNLLVIIRLQTFIQLAQVLLAQIAENRKDRGRCCSGRVEIPILDGGVDARICCLLYGFVYREQPSERIGNIGAGFIQAHS